MKRFVVVIIAVLLLALCGCAEEKTQQEQAEEAVSEIEGMDLGQFQAAQLSEEEPFTQNYLAEYDLNIFYFWSTWSEVSQSQLAQLASYKKELPKNIRIATVCIDGSEHPKKAKKYLRDARFTGRTLIYGDRNFSAVANAVRLLPTVVFFDSSGNQTGKPIIGIMDDFKGTMDETIEGILHIRDIREKDKS